MRFLSSAIFSRISMARSKSSCAEALSRWKEAGHEIIILTARQKDWFGNPVTVSRDWLEKRKIPYDAIVAERWDKGLYCKEHGISVLVSNASVLFPEPESPVSTVSEFRGMCTSIFFKLFAFAPLTFYDYLRLLFARAGTPHCPKCGREIRRQTVDEIADRVTAIPRNCLA